MGENRGYSTSGRSRLSTPQNYACSVDDLNEIRSIHGIQIGIELNVLRLNGLNVTGDDAGTQSRNTFNFQEIGRLEGNRMRVKHERVKDDDLDGQTNGRGGIVSETQVKKRSREASVGTKL